MLRFLLITIVATATAKVINDGPCPEVKPVENFNLTAYQGIWYEISRLPTDYEKNGKCSQAENKLEGDVFKIKNSHVVDGVQKYVEGTAKLADDANKAAKLVISLKIGERVSNSDLMVLTTDYNNYAVAYNCKYDDKTKKHEITAWILSRTKKLEGDAKAAVDNYLKNNLKEVDVSKFEQNDFSEEACKFTSSSSVAETTKS